MIQAADLPDGDDSSDRAWLDGARVRAILVEYKMRPRSVVATKNSENAEKSRVLGWAAVVSLVCAPKIPCVLR